MRFNFHTHTTFCDGEASPEEIVRYAIEQGFSVLGFSGHGYTPFDTSYCIKDTAAYRQQIRRLQNAYCDKIQIYLGVEEDVFARVRRADFDYIIGSSHYLYRQGSYYPIDENVSDFEKCLALFGGNAQQLAKAYYDTFCRYIVKRKPDVVGHFDLITKFEEVAPPAFTQDAAYQRLAKEALKRALKSDVIFEVNTGAIARGLRTAPYPHEALLYQIRKCGGKITLASDSHTLSALDFHFAETKVLLRDLGFREVYVLYDGRWTKTPL